MPFLTISYRNKRSFAGLTVGTCELVDLDSAVVVLTQLEVLDAVVLVGRVLDQVVAHSVRARISGNLFKSIKTQNHPYRYDNAWSMVNEKSRRALLAFLVSKLHLWIELTLEEQYWRQFLPKGR